MQIAYMDNKRLEVSMVDEKEVSQPNKSNENITEEKGNNISLTAEQKANIERNRQKALLLKESRMKSHPYAKTSTADTVAKTLNKVQGPKFIDTGGGFLLEENDDELNEITLTQEPAPIIEPDRPTCVECKQIFDDSFLFQTFEHPVCDTCRDNEEKHALITKTDAKNVYLLKDCDLEKREPLLKFLVRKNPHNVRWGNMKLFLELQEELFYKYCYYDFALEFHSQLDKKDQAAELFIDLSKAFDNVAKRAIEVWGSEEELEAERERREEERAKSKMKKYNKQLKALRMNVRSSLYDRTSAASHEHEFGPETYNEDDETYSHTCITCNYSETFEKM